MARPFADMPVVSLSDRLFMSGQLSSELAGLAQEHGPIFRTPVQNAVTGSAEFVRMIGPEANRFVLHTHRDRFSHDRGWTPIIGESLGKGLLNMDEPEHGVHRRMWNPAFASACMALYLPVITQVVAERTAGWAARGEVDVFEEARAITFDAAAGALAGLMPGPEVDRLRELFFALLHGFDDREVTWEEYVAHIGQVRMELGGRLLTRIAERRRLPVEAQPRDVVAMIVHARDEHGQALDDMQVLAHLNILLVAGHETTTTLGAWVLYLLTQYPEYRQRIEAELAAVLGPGDAPLTMEAIRALKELDNFVREAGRLYPPVIQVPRGVVQDFEFAGYTVPAGAEVRLGIGPGHRLPGVFAHPDVFDPDRFAPPRDEEKRTPYGLITFGGGPRVCIGMHFAQVEVKALAAHVLRTYRLAPAAGARPVHAGGLTGVIPGGIHLRVTPRA